MNLRLAAPVVACMWLWGLDATAKQRFENSYVAFDMPDGWLCRLDQTEWVCRPTGNTKRAMVVILTAKEADHRDTLTVYQRHLNEVARRPGVRTVEAARMRDIGGGTFWVDGSYEGAEIKNYITRYLAGVKDGVAVLVTFSVHRDYYAANRGLNDLVANSVTLKKVPRRR